MFFGGQVIFKYSVSRGSFYLNHRVVHPMLKRRKILHTEYTTGLAFESTVEKIYSLKDFNLWRMRDNDKLYKKLYATG